MTAHPLIPNYYTHPILSCHESSNYEFTLFQDDIALSNKAMHQAGQAIGHAIYRDYYELEALPETPLIFLLAGRGHNTGDALIATQTLLKYRPHAQIHLLFTSSPPSDWKPELQKIYQSLQSQTHIIEHFFTEANEVQLRTLLQSLTLTSSINILIDGILGLAFHPPLPPHLKVLFSTLNHFPLIKFRAAIDLPSGIADISDSPPFQAGFTYTPGIAKAPLFDPAYNNSVGRIRYLDLGFFSNKHAKHPPSPSHITLSEALTPLQTLRSSASDKRAYAHLILIGGSCKTPGAILMAAKAALTSGIGLLTVLTVQSQQAALAAALPEAMWVACPENSSGCLLPSAVLAQLESLAPKTQAILIGPGIGPIGSDLIPQVLASTDLPTVIDAEAIQFALLESLRRRKSPTIITPHPGEWRRISNTEPTPENLQNFAQQYSLTIVLKAFHSLIISPHYPLTYNNTGGPLLARGGSGDLLAGIVATLLAQYPSHPHWVASAATYWHGLAADLLAQARGQIAVTTTDLLRYLSSALRISTQK